MPYELFLALRYLYSRRRRRLARVTALAAILGIAFGVAALIVALALGNGFRDEMRDKILKGTAHLTLMRADGEMMSDWRTILRRVRAVKGVTDATATTYEGALLSGPRASAYAVLRGLDPESGSAVAQIRRTLIAGTFEPLLREQPAEKEAASTSTGDASTAEEEQQREQQQHAPREEKSVERRAQKREDEKAPAVTSFDGVTEEAELPAVVIGAELAERAGLKPLDVAQIISGETTLTPLGLAPRYRRVRVVGIFRSGLYEYDASWVYLSLASAASFAGQPAPAASVISIEVADIYAAGETGARVRASLGAEFTTVDWQEANRQLFTALALERRMGLIILALIILIAALNITTTLVLVVVERRADIAILSAMGARARSIMYVFIIEGACVGSIGALCGVALGLILCVAGDRYKLVSLPADVYSLSSVPFHPQARDVLMAALLALLLSLLATIYPARAAARLRPAEALRDTN
ncbi:MAG TPA: FtsX-like permease family protein [Pyrinomonadaceae bacterium]|jgi:lipoprotein-releasing system permease protein